MHPQTGSYHLPYLFCSLVSGHRSAWKQVTTLFPSIFVRCLLWFKGYAVNPARDFGPRLFLAMAGYGKAVFNYRRYVAIVLSKSRHRCAIIGSIFRTLQHQCPSTLLPSSSRLIIDDLVIPHRQYWIWAPIIAPILGAQAGGLLYDIFLYDGDDSPIKWR
jgi:aquaglyceroporin related protein